MEPERCRVQESGIRRFRVAAQFALEGASVASVIVRPN